MKKKKTLKFTKLNSGKKQLCLNYQQLPKCSKIKLLTEISHRFVRRPNQHGLWLLLRPEEIENWKQELQLLRLR